MNDPGCRPVRLEAADGVLAEPCAAPTAAPANASGAMSSAGELAGSPLKLLDRPPVEQRNAQDCCLASVMMP